MLCRVLPPLRTPYRVIVENISSRTSWQVRMLSVCVCAQLVLCTIWERISTSLDCVSHRNVCDSAEN